MLELYFCPRVVRWLQSNTHSKVLVGLLTDLHSRGYARNTIQNYVGAAEVFLRWLSKHDTLLSTLDEATVREFACRQRSRKRPRSNTHAALRHLLRHLRDNRPAPTSAPVEPPAVARIVTEFDAYLEHTCGLATATLACRRRYAREFLQDVFGAGRVDWRRLRPRRLQAFIARYGRDSRLAAAAMAAVSLRSFLRWLQFRGRISGNLAEAVPHLARWRMASLPTVMTDEQLQGFLASFDKDRASGRRDYALALCMVDLGLRVSEVANLTLDDLNEAAGTLRLTAGRGRRVRMLPMHRHVRKAIGDYVRRDRPPTDDRHLFVRHRVPVGRAVTRELIRGVVRRAYATVPGCEKWTGTHVLRHTAATRLHRAGADLKCVADTRNTRLVAIRAFIAYASARDPTILPLAQRVLAIPQKRFDRPLLGYLTRAEVEAVFDAPDRSTWSGRRDRTLFMVMYNTGTRVSEVIGLRRGDLDVGPATSVQIHGKGRK
jgi:site-specific recombinase XerD